MAGVEIDGVDLAYEELGSGSPPALLVHGTGGALWGELPTELAKERRTIWYHRRGFGASVHPPIKDHPRHTADAATLLERLDAAPAVLVGWSMGGVISLHLALTRPELVHSIVLIEPPFQLRKHPNLGMLREVGGVMVARRFKGERPAALRFLRFATRYSDAGNGFDESPPDGQEAILANAPAIMRELDSGTGEHIKAADLGTISCPVVCLVGERTAPEYGAAAGRIQKELPSTRIEPVQGAGHTLPLTHPEAVVDAVRSVTRAPRRSFPAPARR
jgi:pimeloyl-ACP methyl ester carboxylesterase